MMDYEKSAEEWEKEMTRKPPPLRKTERKIKVCLKCRRAFISIGSGNRICRRCNADNTTVGKMMAARGEAIVGEIPRTAKKGID